MKLAIAATAAVAALVLGGLFLVLFTTVVPSAAACAPAAMPATVETSSTGATGPSAASDVAAPAQAVAFRTLQSGGAVGDIPPAYAVLYQRAAAKYKLGEWATLAAVGSIETDHGRSPLPGVKSGTNSAGAAGP